jgi:murein L,D-transpeptidase YafK
MRGEAGAAAGAAPRNPMNLTSLIALLMPAGVLLVETCRRSDRDPAAAAVEAATLPSCSERAADLPAAPFLDRTDPRLIENGLVVVVKAARTLAVYDGGRLVRTTAGGPACWRVGLGRDDDGEHPVGPKTREGDRRTPEGWYRTSDKPMSRFHAAIAVHYPNADDAAAGLAAGRIDETVHATIVAALAEGARPPQNTPLGGEILIHGGGNVADWTHGCIGMADADIDLLRTLLPGRMHTDLLILP